MSDKSTTNSQYKTKKELYKLEKRRRKQWKEEKLLKKLKKSEQHENKTTELPQEEKIEVKFPSTISLAVPGSILDNAQTADLRTYLAGQIARAACIFQVDEVIVFDDYGETINDKVTKVENEDGIQTIRRCCAQLARILQYLECPQYLRRLIFPFHPDLQKAGLLNPLDAPHHLRQDNNFIFREGIVTSKPTKDGRGSYVNIGLQQDVQVDKELNPGIRVTVKLLPPAPNSKKVRGIIVAPNVPRAETGVYWGYTVRIAKTLSQIISQSPYKEGYDLMIGTSDKGTIVDDATLPEYEHALIVFGGLQGLEAALENDEVLDTDDPADLFGFYLNTLPNQGSRTIRTEEAILISLAALRFKLNPKTKPKSFVS